MIYGYIKDKPDPKDYQARDLLRGLAPVALPEYYYVVNDPPLMNQGNTPQCVAYGMTLIRRLHEIIEVGDYPAFDPAVLYSRCKEKDGIPNVGGTYPRVALDIMKHEGMPVKGYLSRSIFPCMRKSNFHPGYKIGGYWRIEKETDDQIKRILMEYGAISAACTWFVEWCEMDGIGVFPEPKYQEGGHHWVIAGWNLNGWYVVNSWGRTWGIDGCAYMPFDMFRKYVLPEGDVWKMTDTITTYQIKNIVNAANSD